MIWSFAFTLFTEVVIGLIIGFAARLVFAAIEVGSEVVGMQIGFGLANAFDPVSNQQVSLIRQVYVALASLIFLAINGHHLIIRALVKSFEWIPSKGFFFSAPLIHHIIRMGSDLFLVGMKIAAPVMITLILAQMAMGIVSRVVPQLQVFLFSLSLTIGIGLMMIGFSLSLYSALLQNQMGGALETRLGDLMIRMR
jgi:flagellar biosynthetic protein FliR